MDKQLIREKRQEHSLTSIALDSIKPVLPRIESSSLFNNVREIIIDHMGQEYHLRVTNQGKLLLTK
jgi:hemin uptake protein HemP